MFDLNDALRKNVGEIERPKLLPIGAYRWMIEKHPEISDIADGRFQVLDFQLRCLGATEDVDTDALEEYGKVENARLRHRFMFSREDTNMAERSLFNLRRFLEEHVGSAEPETPLNEALAQSVNGQFIGVVRWRADKNNPEVQYAEIGTTAPLD